MASRRVDVLRLACRSAGGTWKDIFAEAVKLVEQHTGTMGCRSLDILHCAAARTVAASEFISTDSRQKKLAAAWPSRPARIAWRSNPAPRVSGRG